MIGDPQRLDALDAEIVATGVSLLALYFLVLGLVVLVGYGLCGGYRAPWIWPDRSFTGTYVLATGQLLVTAIVADWLISRAGAFAAAGLLVSTPLVTLAVLALTLGTPTSRNERGAAAVIVAVGGAAMLALTAATTDWAGAAAVAVTGALWAIGAMPPTPRGRAAGLAIGVGATAVLAFMVLDSPVALVAGIAVASTTGAAAMPFVPRRLTSWSGRSELAFRGAYVAMLLALLGVLAAVPAVVCMRDAVHYVQTAFVKHNELELALALKARRERLRTRATKRDSELATDLQATMVADRHDLYHEVWMALPVPEDRRVAAGEARPRSSNGCQPAGSTRDTLSNWVNPWLPAGNRLVVDLRRSTGDGATDGSWCWTQQGPEIALDPGPALEEGLAKDAELLRSLPVLVPHAEDDDGRLGARGPWSIILAGLVLLGAGGWLLTSIVRRIFLLDIDARGTADENLSGGPATRRIFTFTRDTRPRDDATPVARAELLDLSTADGAEAIRTLATKVATKPVVEVHHLEAVLSDSALADATLSLLRSLLGDPTPREIRLTSEVDPIARLQAGLGESPADAPAVRARADGWASVLARFSRTLVPLTDESLAKRFDGATYVDDASDDENDDRLQPRNRRVWMHCTRDERVVLRQLADEGFLNPNNGDLERDLFRRGLIRRSPAFALLDRSLRRFVLRAAPASDVAAWEAQGNASGWSRLRGPLLALCVLACVFFFLTKRTAFDYAVGTASAFGASVPILQRLLAMLNDWKGAVPPKS